MPWKAKDYTGKQYGYLTAVRRVGTKQPGYRALWEYKCACGNTVARTANSVVGMCKKGLMPSCGCKFTEHHRNAGTSHAMSKHPAYKIWTGMKKRCSPSCKGKFRKNYYEKGIRVCPQWLTWEGFWKDMGSTWKSGLTIDRIDSNGDYEPNNCRWATWKEQQNNRCTNHLVGQETITQFAERHGLNPSTVRARIAYGWPEDKLGLPLREWYRSKANAKP